MVDSIKHLDLNLKHKRPMLSLMQRIRRFKSRIIEQNKPLLEMYQVSDKDGTMFKMIELTEEGRMNESCRNKLKAVREYLFSSDNGIVPSLKYADDAVLVLDWVSGVTLNTCKLNQADYIQLGQFLIDGLYNVELVQGNKEVVEFFEYIGHLKRKNAFDESTILELKSLTERIKMPKDKWLSAIGFGDSVDKNFVKKDDGSLSYIDVFGITRLSVGMHFAKRIAVTPAQYRAALAKAFAERLKDRFNEHQFDVFEYLSFYYLKFILARISIGYQRNIKKRIKIGQRLLGQFIKHGDTQQQTDDWILNVAEPMV